MNLRQLKYFAAVVEAGNMTRAADRLHVAQTALGMQVRQLEESLAASVMPYHAVIDEVRAGTLDARPIAMPAIRRTLFLASSKQLGPFRNQAGLTGAIRSSMTGQLAALGPLGHPLWARTA